MAEAGLKFSSEVSEQELEVISAELEKEPPETILGWALEVFGPEVALATGFGAEGCVLIHMTSTINKKCAHFLSRYRSSVS